jgi:glycosyltransferase involved in cell wall biosynthesis
MKNIVIFNNLLLEKSQTFVKWQSESLKTFLPHYVGLRRVEGLSLNSDNVITLNSGGLLGWFHEILLKAFGISPYLLKKLKNINPSLIHAHFGGNGAMILSLSKQLRVPLVVTFHGFDITNNDNFFKNSFSGRLYLRKRDELKRDAKLFIAVSEFIKERLLDSGFPNEKIKVHYIGVDTKYFQPEFNITREKIVLFTGRLVEKKGCEYLVKAMAKVQSSYPELKLIIIGDGPLRDSLEELAQGCLKNYTFLGHQAPEIVKDWMQRALVFCVPSITARSGDSEAFGMVFAEAQAMGLPVVSCSSGGIPEVVLHGSTGFLARERDYDELATYITCLVEDQNLWKSFSIAGRKLVEEKFNLDEQTSKLESIYANLCILSEE